MNKVRKEEWKRIPYEVRDNIIAEIIPTHCVADAFNQYVAIAEKYEVPLDFVLTCARTAHIKGMHLQRRQDRWFFNTKFIYKEKD